MRLLGIDIGGTGIKGAPVDTETGELLAPRQRLATPHPAVPDAVAATVAQVVDGFAWTGPIGAAFPAVIKNNVAMTAANIDESWIGTDVAAALSDATGRPEVVVLNDADAAGVAEMAFGAGRDNGGVVIMTTFGTGIGTAVFLHGQLVPNTEFGHLEVHGQDAETKASELARERDDLSWEKWAKRVNRYLTHLEALLWPDLIIIGGGASRKADRFLDRLELRTKVVPAQLQNEAGIVGAALFAGADQTRPRPPARPRRRSPATRPPGGRRP
jgi:polyphosphate glucokinase